MDETSLNAKRGIEGISTFESVLVLNLAYWNPFSLKVALMKLIFLVGIHYMQGGTATAKHGVLRKRSAKRLKHTANIFRKNLL